MNIRISIGLALMVASPGTASAASTETGSTEPGCLSAYGDIWGERRSAIAKDEIDGGQIESRADFVRLASRAEPGVTIIKGGDFSGWDFSDMPLSGVCFEESKLAGAIFTNAKGSGAGFIKADLTDANMAGADMPGILFRNAGLKNVQSGGANFSKGHFDGGWFEGNVEGWNIDGSDMTGFTFDCGITVPDGCPVYQGGAPISAKDADFSGATLHGFGLSEVELTGAILDQTIIGPRQLPHLATADFRGDIILRGGGDDGRLTADEAQTLWTENDRWQMMQLHPSFDCAKAASTVEQLICADYGHALRSADRDIAFLYQQAKGRDPEAKASQMAWLKQRDLCAEAEYPSECLGESYSQRKSQLLGLLGETDWLAPGESALFIDDVLPLPAAFRQSALFGRIAPALVGASMTTILIERRNDGLYAINGRAVGANAHLCSIAASHLYFDKQSGWYIPVSEGPAIPIFRIFDGRLEIFANGKPDHEKYPESADFMSCGMRAYFPETIRINAGDEMIITEHVVPREAAKQALD
ncbi:pentapeptide repeat-containing protein [Parasphingorhabdus sp.]|uniref:pentapeptide repeat-containing protein n=1 Tax=Parasphingorhabdus sp. TaxID=2709688 RepID=UPI0035946DB8